MKGACGGVAVKVRRLRDAGFKEKGGIEKGTGTTCCEERRRWITKKGWAGQRRETLTIEERERQPVFEEREVQELGRKRKHDKNW